MFFTLCNQDMTCVNIYIYINQFKYNEQLYHRLYFFNSNVILNKLTLRNLQTLVFSSDRF